MKTTIDIADSLLNEARGVAARDGVTVNTLLEQGLRGVLAERKCFFPFHLRKARSKAKGFRGESRIAHGSRFANWPRGRESTRSMTDLPSLSPV